MVPQPVYVQSNETIFAIPCLQNQPTYPICYSTKQSKTYKSNNMLMFSSAWVSHSS